jgi:hypothetical protein
VKWGLCVSYLDCVEEVGCFRHFSGFVRDKKLIMELGSALVWTGEDGKCKLLIMEDLYINVLFIILDTLCKIIEKEWNFENVVLDRRRR